MPFETDIAYRVSPQLSTLIQAELDREDTEEPATLERVLQRVHSGLFDELAALGQVDAAAQGEVVTELKELVEQYGGEVLAFDFVRTRASDDLARVIEAEISTPVHLAPPTLGVIRDAILNGRAAAIAGTGDISIDDDDNLIDEIDALIARFGEDATAEEFLP